MLALDSGMSSWDVHAIAIAEVAITASAEEISENLVLELNIINLIIFNIYATGFKANYIFMLIMLFQDWMIQRIYLES